MEKFLPFLGESAGQGWVQVYELAFAFVLSALIGLEREYRQKSAGLRTHTLVGFAAALIMLISKYGFTNVLVQGLVAVDPSHVAAQIVSGIGFIGGGLIFVRRDSVRGLTTAAIVWLTASVGMACGAGLPILALEVTAGHFIVVFTFPYIERRLPKSRWAPSVLQVSYEDGEEVLRDILVLCTQNDFAVSRLRVEREGSADDFVDRADILSLDRPMNDDETRAEHAASNEARRRPRVQRIATVVLEIQGVRAVSKLAAKLANINGVVSVNAGDANVPFE